MKTISASAVDLLCELLRRQRRSSAAWTAGSQGRFRPARREILDPTMAVIRPPFTATFNNYVRADLGYKSDLEYNVLGGLPVGLGIGGQGFPDTSDSLRRRLSKILT